MKRISPPAPLEMLQKIEAIESSCRKAHDEIMTPAAKEKQHLLTTEIAGADIRIAGERADKKIARVYGFGVQERVTESDLNEIIDYVRTQNVKSVRFRVPPTAQASEAAEWLVKKGFRRLTFVAVWLAPLESIRPVESDFEIGRLQESRKSEFGQLVATNYRLKSPDDAEYHSRLQEIPGMSCFQCVDDETLIGTGAIYRQGAGCILEYGTTEKTYRNRGIQTAMIGFRLNEAKRMECEWATSSTITNDKSSRNLRKQGFEKAYDDLVYACEF